jgi:hypothetical protein
MMQKRRKTVQRKKKQVETKQAAQAKLSEAAVPDVDDDNRVGLIWGIFQVVSMTH